MPLGLTYDETLLRDKLHHTICKALGLQTETVCPNCGEAEWHREERYSKHFKLYTQGDNTEAYYKLEDEEYEHYGRYYCYECGHEEEFG